MMLQEILEKARRYCAYQERCHQEVRSKLYELGCRTETVDEILVRLIESGHLNEERFARAYAGGKFRTKKWGRNKIIQELKMRKVSPYCIRQAMLEIDEDDYLKTLKSLAEKHLPAKPTAMDRQKTIKWLLGKGYEMELIRETVLQDSKEK